MQPRANRLAERFLGRPRIDRPLCLAALLLMWSCLTATTGLDGQHGDHMADAERGSAKVRPPRLMVRPNCPQAGDQRVGTPALPPRLKAPAPRRSPYPWRLR